MQRVMCRMNHAIFLVVLGCTLTPFVRAQQQCEPAAVAVAQRFIRAQFQGASIGGSRDAFKEAVPLMIDDGEPPASPIIYVAGYKVQDDVMVGEKCRITILYERLGTISPESFILKPAKSEETAHIWLTRDENTWKVHMDAKQYGLPPHVGVEAIRNWLHLFLQPPFDAKTVKAKHLLAMVDGSH